MRLRQICEAGTLTPAVAVPENSVRDARWQRCGCGPGAAGLADRYGWQADRRNGTDSADGRDSDGSQHQQRKNDLDQSAKHRVHPPYPILEPWDILYGREPATDKAGIPADQPARATSTSALLYVKEPPGEYSSLVRTLAHPARSTPLLSGEYQAP